MPLLCLTGRWACRRQQRRRGKDKQIQTDDSTPLTQGAKVTPPEWQGVGPLPSPPPPTPVPSDSFEYMDQEPPPDLGQLVLRQPHAAAAGGPSPAPGSRLSCSSPQLLWDPPPQAAASSCQRRPNGRDSPSQQQQQRDKQGGSLQVDLLRLAAPPPHTEKHAVYHKNSYMAHVSRRRPYCRHGFQGYLRRSLSLSSTTPPLQA